MEQPDICPDLFFYIMLNCWESDSSQRKGFQALVRDIDEILKTNLKVNNGDFFPVIRMNYVKAVCSVTRS